MRILVDWLARYKALRFEDEHSRQRINQAWESLGEAVAPCQTTLAASRHLTSDEKTYFSEYATAVGKLTQSLDPNKDIENVTTLQSSHRDFEQKVIILAKEQHKPASTEKAVHTNAASEKVKTMFSMTEDQARYWDSLCKIIGVIALVIGGIWTVGTYFDKKVANDRAQDKLRLESLETAKREARKPFLDRRLDLYMKVMSSVATIGTSRDQKSHRRRKNRVLESEMGIARSCRRRKCAKQNRCCR